MTRYFLTAALIVFATAGTAYASVETTGDDFHGVTAQNVSDRAIPPGPLELALQEWASSAQCGYFSACVTDADCWPCGITTCATFPFGMGGFCIDDPY